MVKLKYSILILCFSLPVLLFGQNKYTISGTVKDHKTGEEIINAVIGVPLLKGASTTSNTYGFYSLTLNEGEYEIKISSLGYQNQIKSINLNQNITIDFLLDEIIYESQEITVTGKKNNDQISNAQMGVEQLEIKVANKIPVLLGEKDILKTLQLLPGIKSAGEGGSGFNVRGGGTDQNLILLDEAPVYNASHLLGFFSTFNSDAIKDVQIFKGGMPAQYGGRLSSVLDIKMKEGNNQKLGASGGIGLISSRLNIEGPIVKDKGSFIISGRRTYLDQFLKLSNDTSINTSQLYFYDLNIKTNYRFNDQNRLFISIYNGRDKIGIANRFGIDWGNTTVTTRWNKIINAKWFSNTSLIYSKYSYKIGLKSGTGNIDITSNIQDYNIKQEFNYYKNPSNSFTIGLNSIYHTITPGQISSTNTSINSRKLQDRFGLENAFYLTHDLHANEKLAIHYGLRISSFSLLGAGNFYSYNSEGIAIDTNTYASGENVKTYLNFEPRISSSYLLNNNNSIKLSYARNVQYLHLISNSTSTDPTDLWIPSSNNVKPQLSDQFSIGYYQNFKDNTFELSVESYYKNMYNQIDYRNGGNTRANEKIEGELLFGKGRAYGIEFLIKKKIGKLTGWIGYTLSRTERQINGINNNNWYAAKQDRTHDISVVGIYEISQKFSISGTWVYNTGNAVTFPSGKYYIDGKVQYLYTERNGYRMPAYHRMDIGLTWIRKKTERFESSWNFSIYNAYGRENAYTITFQTDPLNVNKTQAIQTSLFRFVPAVSYNFKF